ncbi:MAG: hypothetical protein M1819_004631 [Sarea resinae]|nr:MAG: hypothetical protein M1819_004631 [Sarea resinae]
MANLNLNVFPDLPQIHFDSDTVLANAECDATPYDETPQRSYLDYQRYCDSIDLPLKPFNVSSPSISVCRGKGVPTNIKQYLLESERSGFDTGALCGYSTDLSSASPATEAEYFYPVEPFTPCEAVSPYLGMLEQRHLSPASSFTDDASLSSLSTGASQRSITSNPSDMPLAYDTPSCTSNNFNFDFEVDSSPSQYCFPGFEQQQSPWGSSPALPQEQGLGLMHIGHASQLSQPAQTPEFMGTKRERDGEDDWDDYETTENQFDDNDESEMGNAVSGTYVALRQVQGFADDSNEAGEGQDQQNDEGDVRALPGVLPGNRQSNYWNQCATHLPLDSNPNKSEPEQQAYQHQLLSRTFAREEIHAETSDEDDDYMPPGQPLRKRRRLSTAMAAVDDSVSRLRRRPSRVAATHSIAITTPDSVTTRKQPNNERNSKPTATKGKGKSKGNGKKAPTRGSKTSRFPCPFSTSSSTSTTITSSQKPCNPSQTYSSKNELKRHLLTQHFCLGVWVCDFAPCCPLSPTPRLPSGGEGGRWDDDADADDDEGYDEGESKGAQALDTETIKLERQSDSHATVSTSPFTPPPAKTPHPAQHTSSNMSSCPRGARARPSVVEKAVEKENPQDQPTATATLKRNDSGSTDGVKRFNRKDLFVQHLKRMHGLQLSGAGEVEVRIGVEADVDTITLLPFQYPALSPAPSSTYASTSSRATSAADRRQPQTQKDQLATATKSKTRVRARAKAPDPELKPNLEEAAQARSTAQAIEAACERCYHPTTFQRPAPGTTTVIATAAPLSVSSSPLGSSPPETVAEVDAEVDAEAKAEAEAEADTHSPLPPLPAAAAAAAPPPPPPPPPLTATPLQCPSCHLSFPPPSPSQSPSPSPSLSPSTSRSSSSPTSSYPRAHLRAEVQTPGRKRYQRRADADADADATEKLILALVDHIVGCWLRGR